MIEKILSSKTKTVTFAAILLAGSSLVSAILGLFRDNLLANLLVPQKADIYFAAFRVPDFIYGILITGGIIAAFLPVFAEQFKKSNQDAQRLTNNVLTVFLVGLIFISIFLAIFTPRLVEFVAPGFSKEQKILTVSLTRIMFLSPILLGASAVFAGILHYFDLFFAVALSPIFYNIGIILGILVFRNFFDLQGLAWGVVLGAFLHLIFHLLPVLRLGFRPRFYLNLNCSGLRKIFKLMIPRVLGTGASQINLIVITSIASTLGPGSISVFNFANNLQGIPINLIGVSFAAAVFPTLSKHWISNEKQKFFENFSKIFSQILFLVIPSSILLFLLRAQIVRLILGVSIFKNGGFDWWRTRLTAASLGIFSLFLVGATLVPLLARAFFSLQDTKTPVKIAIFSMILNVALSYSLVWGLKFENIFQRQLIGFLKLKELNNVSVVGLPLAVSISALVQFFLLCIFLKKRVKDLEFKNLTKLFLKIFFAALIMAVVVFLSLKIFSSFFNTSTVLGLLSQTFLSLIFGILVYIGASLALEIEEPQIIWSSILTQFKRKF